MWHILYKNNFTRESVAGRSRGQGNASLKRPLLTFFSVYLGNSVHQLACIENNDIKELDLGYTDVLVNLDPAVFYSMSRLKKLSVSNAPQLSAFAIGIAFNHSIFKVLLTNRLSVFRYIDGKHKIGGDQYNLECQADINFIGGVLSLAITENPELEQQ